MPADASVDIAAVSLSPVELETGEGSALPVEAAADNGSVPVELATGVDSLANENAGVLEDVPDSKESAFLGSDGSLAIHAGMCLGQSVLLFCVTKTCYESCTFLSLWYLNCLMLLCVCLSLLLSTC